MVLQEIDIDVVPGSITGLVAPNGVGKTTLMRTILGMIPTLHGKISIDDSISYSSKKQKIKMLQNISLLPDQSELFEGFSGMEHLKLYKNSWKSKVNLDELITDLNMDYYVKNRVSSYSLGMRQRLCFAMQLASDTPYMMMDEVMNGLDPNNVKLLSDILFRLKKSGKGIMISSHLLENLEEISDVVYFQNAGKIVAKFVKDEYDLAHNGVFKLQFKNEEQAIQALELLTIDGKVSHNQIVLSNKDMTHDFTKYAQTDARKIEFAVPSLRDFYKEIYDV
jgi:ABC-2 type transport system ATP-binding protein